MKNVPDIRFKGFDEEWGSCELNNFAKKVTQKNYSKEYNDTFTNSAEYGVIDQKDYFDRIISNNNNIGGYYVVEKDDFIYNPRVSTLAPVGPISRNNLGYTGVVSPLYFVFKVSNINKDFLEVFFKTNLWHKYMRIEGNCGARFDRLSISDSQFLDMPISHPINKDEQKTIASYFCQINNQLSEQQKKIASLKQLKSASLISMFPQQGETVPRVRFKGFDGEWIICKLKKFASKVTRKNSDKAYTRTLTNSAEFGVIDQNDYFDRTISNSENIGGYYVVENNDYIYNPRVSALAPVGPINRNKLGYIGVVSPLYLVFKVNNIEKDFFDVYFKTNLWHRYMKIEGNCGARFDRLSISDEQFFEMPIIHPSSEDEQHQIASYFRQLDIQISEQEKRLEKLKQIKAACLDKMFV